MLFILNILNLAVRTNKKMVAWDILGKTTECGFLYHGRYKGYIIDEQEKLITLTSAAAYFFFAPQPKRPIGNNSISKNKLAFLMQSARFKLQACSAFGAEFRHRLTVCRGPSAARAA